MMVGVLVVVSNVQAADVIWISSASSYKWQQMPAPTLFKGTASTVRIAPSKTYQTIDGFGGCFNELGWQALSHTSNSNAVMAALFGANGCSFTQARIPIGASDFATSYYSLDDTAGDYSLNNFSIARDQQMLIPYLHAAMAVQPNLQCWASPWTPPQWMKNNNSYAGGSLTWNAQTLQSYANYFVRWINAYRGAGINIYAVTPQNEPNISSSYPSCIWSGTQLRDFIATYLGPTLINSNASVQLWLGINGDPVNGGENINDRIKTVLTDPTANSYIDGVGFQYDSNTQIGNVYAWQPAKKLVQTETKCYSGANSWSDAQDLYANLKRYFENGANAYFMWNMVLDQTGLSTWGWQQNAMITVDSGTGQVTYNGEYYVMRHFSQFVQPGAKRVLTTGWWGDKIAFQNPDGSVVLVMGNSSGSDQAVSITRGGWSGADTISATLPAGSINTFVFPSQANPAPLTTTTAPAVLMHRYSFNETSGSTVSDSIGGANGSLPNGGTWGGGQLSLSSGSSQYVNLPANILTGYSNVTIEAWVSYPTGLPTWARLFDFGNKSGSDGVNYIMFAPQTETMKISNSNYTGEQGFAANQDLSYQTNLHITAVINPPDKYMALYVNGVLVGLNNNITISMGSVNDVYSYIGRSLYQNDPYCDFVLDEFRIYSGALTAYEVQATQALGPDQLLETGSTPISLAVSPGNATIGWPVGYASSMMLQSRTNLVMGAWEDHASLYPELIGNQWQLNLPLSKPMEFFRLKR